MKVSDQLSTRPKVQGISHSATLAVVEVRADSLVAIR
jgi:hypothetical protein